LELGVPVSIVADLAGHTIKTMEMQYKNHKLRKMTHELVKVKRKSLEENDFLTFDMD
jgi:integrase